LCAAFYVICPTLESIRLEEGLPRSLFQYGMTHDGAGLPRGWACTDNDTSGPAGDPAGTSWTWDSDGSYTDWYAGHEIGHPLGRAHPTPGSAECGHSASDDGFPWPLAAIGDASLRGFDVGDTGLNPLLTMRLYPSDTWRDMMSYCPNQWISDYTYNGLRTRLGSTAGAAAAPEATAAGPYLQLSGILFTEGDTADIAQLRIWPDLAPAPAAPVPGGYRIRLKDGIGGVLASYDFTPTGGDEHGTIRSVSEVVHLPAGTRRAEIVRIAGDVLLWHADISAHAPVVTGVQLAGAPSPVSGMVTLQWNAADADGDALVYDVLYSADDGAHWQFVRMGASGNSVQMDTSELAGSSAGRFKVLAHDGGNQGEGVSPAYAVAAKAPIVTVLNPLDGLRINLGQELVFSAEVFDWQDGSVDTASIEWRDQTNYLLGIGTEFSTADFLTGENVITARATNSLGVTGTATFTIYIGDDLALPGPTLAAAPDQVGWHVGTTEGGAQTAQVTVDNLGSGTLSFSFSEDADWLNVTASGGSAPAVLSLTADPAGLPDGEAWTTTLTVTGGGQSLTIPVTLGRGDLWAPDAVDALTEVIFLPFVTR
jgi:hypothetical protein